MKEEDILKAKKETKANFITIVDDNYPEFFKHLYNPPFLLYYYGNLSLLSYKYRLTVIGTRKPTLYQNNTVYSFVQECEDKLENKMVVVSGMAKGIDQSGMKAAMDKNAPVISVIGSGIDNPIRKTMTESMSTAKAEKDSSFPNILLRQRQNRIILSFVIDFLLLSLM